MPPIKGLMECDRRTGTGRHVWEVFGEEFYCMCEVKGWGESIRDRQFTSNWKRFLTKPFSSNQSNS